MQIVEKDALTNTTYFIYGLRSAITMIEQKLGKQFLELEELKSKVSSLHELLEKNAMVNPVERNVTFAPTIDNEQLNKLTGPLNAKVSRRFALNFRLHCY